MRVPTLLSATLLGLALSNEVFGAVTAHRAQRDVVQRVTSLLKDFPGQGLLPTLSSILGLQNLLPITNIQGDILVGMKKEKELFFFFEIKNAPAFKVALKNHVLPLVTSTQLLLSPPSQQPSAFLNIAFSSSGLAALGITDNLGDANFAAGQFANAEALGDVKATWDSAFAGRSIHGVFLIGSDEVSHIDSLLADVATYFGDSISEKSRLLGAARPGSHAGHEHFGYLDGISQPAISGFSTTVLPGQSMIPPGVILTGELGDTALRPVWARDGSFLAFRKLQQLVPEFKKYLSDNAVQNAARTLSREEGADLLGARMVGRWRSGAPIDLSPEKDDPALGIDPEKNNNFDYSKPSTSAAGIQTSFSDQSRCPFDAHIRKMRPRIDQLNSNIINQAIRAGIPYGPEVTDSERNAQRTTEDRGLAFVMYQSNIANGFRFQQVNWANTASFPNLKNDTTPGIEPIIGQVGGGADRIVGGLDPTDASRDMTVPEFVKCNGGEYFFMPSISALRDKISA